MDATEKDLRKAFEDVTTRNVNESILFGNKTRELVKELEAKLSKYDTQMRERDIVIESLKVQLTKVQSILFKGGTA